MFVSIKKNKYQIIISTIIGCLFYFFTRDEIASMGITIISVAILRYIKIDTILYKNNNKTLENLSVYNI